MLGYSCRKCKRPIQASDSCAMCGPAKSIIIVTGQDQPSLHEAAYEAVRDLKSQLTVYRREEKDCVPSKKEKLRESIRAVAGTMAKLLDSARKLEEDNKSAINKMGVKEQHRLFLSWYQTLPPATRQEVYASMATTESELNETNGGWHNILAEEKA